MKTEDLLSRLTQQARQLGLELSLEQARLLVLHLQLVLSENERQNLTAIRDPLQALARHVVDSLSIVSLIAQAEAGPLVDIGSGAGYPGIPLSVVTGRHVVLLESERRKAEFLQAVIERLEVDAEARWERAESHAIERRDTYSVATARAVSALPSLVELAAPLLAPGGLFIAMKGEPEEEEVVRGSRVADEVGMRFVGLRRLYEADLLGSAAVFRKAGVTPERIPRRVGMAQKRPLA